MNRKQVVTWIMGGKGLNAKFLPTFIWWLGMRWLERRETDLLQWEIFHSRSTPAIRDVEFISCFADCSIYPVVYEYHREGKWDYAGWNGLLMCETTRSYLVVIKVSVSPLSCAWKEGMGQDGTLSIKWIAVVVVSSDKVNNYHHRHHCRHPLSSGASKQAKPKGRKQASLRLVNQRWVLLLWKHDSNVCLIRVACVQPREPERSRPRPDGNRTAQFLNQVSLGMGWRSLLNTAMQPRQDAH